MDGAELRLKVRGREKVEGELDRFLTPCPSSVVYIYIHITSSRTFRLPPSIIYPRSLSNERSGFLSPLEARKEENTFSLFTSSFASFYYFISSTGNSRRRKDGKCFILSLCSFTERHCWWSFLRGVSSLPEMNSAKWSVYWPKGSTHLCTQLRLIFLDFYSSLVLGSLSGSFTIRNGALLSETPDNLSMHKIYEDEWCKERIRSVSSCCTMLELKPRPDYLYFYLCLSFRVLSLYLE